MLDDKLLPRVTVQTLVKINKETKWELSTDDLDAVIEKSRQLGVEIPFEWSEEEFGRRNPVIAEYLSHVSNYFPPETMYNIRFLLTFMYRALEAQASKDNTSLPTISDATYTTVMQGNVDETMRSKGVSDFQAIQISLKNASATMLASNGNLYNALEFLLSYRLGPKATAIKLAQTLYPAIIVYELLRSQGLSDRLRDAHPGLNNL